ncbi:hypothetical protein TIFTF001_007871 [Ficus carica]|uniref:60S ribosomal export protein NMD3 n=1 Tax=Ficus carica TaxID=3494 RepID=A0AA88A7G6_FICCA|nr:hypothetical protein TIFTF001_007871 [Ficus carica]
MAVDTGMFTVQQTIGRVLCCACSYENPIVPNAANMCVNCLRREFNVTEILDKRVVIKHCPECDRCLQRGKTWIKARIKVKLTVQKEAVRGAVLEEKNVIEFVVEEFMCLSCTRIHADPDQWVAVVQVRQYVSHRRTLFYLEQMILKHEAAATAVKIKQGDHGIDFFFSSQSHGERFKDFVSKVTPVMKSKPSEKLKSHDAKSNIYVCRYNFLATISPICREDLICLPPKVAASLGNLGPLVICTKLVEYIVLDVEIVSPEVDIGGSRYALADAQVARLSDFGKNDPIFFIRTHLGHILNLNDSELEKYKGLVLPDAILIRKSYEEKCRRKRGKPHSWKLKSLNMEIDNKGKAEQEKMNTEYERFLKDLEENPDMRFNVSLYQNQEYQPSEIASMTDGEDVPSVPLEELLADLDLSEDEDGDTNMAG